MEKYYALRNFEIDHFSNAIIAVFSFALLAVAFAVFSSTQAQVPVVPAVAAAYAWSPYYYPWTYPAVVAWGSDKARLHRNYFQI